MQLFGRAAVFTLFRGNQSTNGLLVTISGFGIFLYSLDLMYMEKWKGKNTLGWRKKNGHCYVLLSLYNTFSTSMVKIWWTDDSNCAYIPSIHLLFLCSPQICFFDWNPLIVCVLTALDMSHIKWLSSRLFVSFKHSLSFSLHSCKHTHSQTRTYLSHIALENLLEFICR